MLRSPSATFRDQLGKHFYPVAIASVILTLGLVFLYLPTRFAVFGLYGLFGLLGGAVVYYRTNESVELGRRRVDERAHRLGVYIATVATLGIVALSGEPLAVVLGLVVGYGLVVRQLVGEPTPERLIPQLTALFLLSPAVKYLTAGRYIGHGDLLYHVGLVESILGGESISAISAASYSAVPGLHVIAATLSSISGAGAYDGIMLTGLVSFALVVPAIYLITLRLSGDPILAISTALAVTILKNISFFVSYAFPQSIATVMIVALMVVGTMVSRESIKWRVSGVFVVLAVALAFTHHLTQLLFAPLVGCFLVCYGVFGQASVGSLLRSREFALLTVGAVINGLYLALIGFFGRFFDVLLLVLQGGPLGGYSEGIVQGLGVTPPSSSLSLALEWLVSPYALYLVLLLAVFSIGTVQFLRTTGYSASYVAVGWTGLIASLLVLETPLSIKSLIRVGFPWQFAFAFIVGIGLQQLRRRIGPAGSTRLLIGVLVVLAAGAPLVAADNYYGLDPRPPAQTSFTDQEFNELRATESFVENRESQTTVFQETRLVMNRFGTNDLEYAGVGDGSIVIPDGHFVYRSGLANHKISATGTSDTSLYSNDLYISETWLSNRIEMENHVYTAGDTGTLWSPTDRSLDQ